MQFLYTRVIWIHIVFHFLFLCSQSHENNSQGKKSSLLDIVNPLKFLQEPRQEENTKPASSKKRFFNFSYFPFLQTKPIPECADEAICVTGAQCSFAGGTVKGKCYKGFAVCCALEAKCGSTVRTNETYLVNDGYPDAVTALGNCQYNIEKIYKDICQLRLDMMSLELVGPDYSSQCNQDTFSISGGTGATPFVICGNNNGQHMYVDLAEGSSSARINIATSTQGPERKWKIKVSQLPCDSRYKAPANCLQYYTDYSGVMKSFNYQDVDGVHQIANQMYTTCLESKPGFCGVNYKSYDFSISQDGSSEVTAGRPLTGDTDCQRDFISIFTASKERIVQPDRYCGNRFSNVTTFSKPFEIRVMTDDTEDNDNNNRGFSLHYVQIPC